MIAGHADDQEAEDSTGGERHRWNDANFGGLADLVGSHSVNLPEHQARLVRGSLKGTSPTEKMWKRFNDEISSRNDALDVLRIYANHGSEFHVVHLVTAIHRIAKSANGIDSASDTRC
mmetsp:Transcript_29792/g.47991  ORF Transcript_29792/g.47991 Transcript_29792/m.47991 type:complete len:118 (-) Transcript_29792:81-434(-)